MNAASETVTGASGDRAQSPDVEEQRAALANRIGYLLARAWLRRRQSRARAEAETPDESTSTEKPGTTSDAVAPKPSRTRDRRA